MHAETISQDFDFDYNNQFLGIEDKRYNNNNKIAPIGFFGSGLLASPFLFIGSLFNKIFESEKMLYLTIKYYFTQCHLYFIWFYQSYI